MDDLKEAEKDVHQEEKDVKLCTGCFATDWFID